jgi:uncharacterized protein (DUF1015 family)
MPDIVPETTFLLGCLRRAACSRRVSEETKLRTLAALVELCKVSEHAMEETVAHLPSYYNMQFYRLLFRKEEFDVVESQTTDIRETTLQFLRPQGCPSSR